MTLSHFAAEPFTLDRTRTYLQDTPAWYGKPRGFWVSVDGPDDWPSWCDTEQYRPDRLAHRYEVRLASTANIITIDTAYGLLQFEHEWGVRILNATNINWPLLALRYDGLIIAPYQWSCRSRDWYYTWDVASGCIWNLDAIETLELASAVTA